MGKKRITLPGNFEELLKTGDMNELKKVFLSCDVNAKKGRYGSNAFELVPLPKEFAVWLAAQGADVNKKDYYGRTPVFSQASAYGGDVQLLIDLGADIHVSTKDGITPLHLAAAYGRIAAIKALIAHGAEVNARSRDLWGGTRDHTPLEEALIQQRLSMTNMLQVCRLLIQHGADITPKARQALSKLGEQFEFRKSGITDLGFLKENEAALKELYQIFGVTPVKPIEIHDGSSDIIIQETGFVRQYNKMWEYLVPPSGRAKTAQGEVIRIAGKVSYEILDNGGMNWDADYQQMLDAMAEYFTMGNPLSEQDMQQVNKLIRQIYHGQGTEEPELLCAFAVAWVMNNQKVLPVLSAVYKR